MMDPSFAKSLNNEKEDIQIDDIHDHHFNTNTSPLLCSSSDSEGLQSEDTELGLMQYFVSIDTSVNMDYSSQSAEHVKTVSANVLINSSKEESNGKSLTGSETLQILPIGSTGRGRPKKVCPVQQRIEELKTINKTSAKKYREKKKNQFSQLNKQMDVLLIQNNELNNKIESFSAQINGLKYELSHCFGVSLELIDEKLKQYLKDHKIH